MQVTNIKFILVGAIVGLFIAMGFGFYIENSSAKKIEGLVGGWLFDEGGGKAAKDISGNGHDGEIINAKWVAGKFNKALEFGPSDSYVKHHKDFDLKIYTIAAWVKCGKQATYQTILTKTNGKRNYGMFVKPNDGNIHFNLHDAADTRIDSQKKVNDNQWHYCVMTVEKETLRGYIDGEKEETNCGEPAFSTADVTIGAGGDGIRYWMIGAINEPAIFNRVLDEAEIKLKYQKLFDNWLNQYHRTQLEGSDVLDKLQFLKDKLKDVTQSHLYNTAKTTTCASRLK